jgi:N-acetylneuraminate synthase
MSTGMSTAQEVQEAVQTIYGEWYKIYGNEYYHNLTLLHCVSQYPQEPANSNLRTMDWLRQTFPLCRIGYSGHETGLQVSVVAVALGAQTIERHFTTDRSLPGTDHAASLEPEGLRKLCRDIRIIEQALGTPEKCLLDCELPARKKLRGV